MALVFDTGPVLALLDRSDPFHAACLGVAEACTEQLVVPAPCLVEIEYWVRKRLHLDVWNAFVEDVANGAWIVHDLDASDLSRAAELGLRYADLGLGFVDASVVTVCERLGETRVATLDRRHFGVVQPRHCRRLRIVPEVAE